MKDIRFRTGVHNVKCWVMTSAGTAATNPTYAPSAILLPVIQEITLEVTTEDLVISGDNKIQLDRPIPQGWSGTIKFGSAPSEKFMTEVLGWVKDSKNGYSKSVTSLPKEVALAWEATNADGTAERWQVYKALITPSSNNFATSGDSAAEFEYTIKVTSLPKASIDAMYMVPSDTGDATQYTAMTTNPTFKVTK